MVDGSYSQFKATKGRKADREFKKERFDKKKSQLNLSDRKSAPNRKEFTQDEIEATKKVMRQRMARDKRKERLIIGIALAALAAIIVFFLL